MSSEPKWLDSSGTSNRYIQAYIKGFVDISGGNLVLRNNNFYVKNGDASFNCNTFAVKANTISFAGASTITFPNSSINAAAVTGLSTNTFGNLAITRNDAVSYDTDGFENTYNAGFYSVQYIPTTTLTMNGALNCTTNAQSYFTGDLSLGSRLFVGGALTNSGGISGSGSIATSSGLTVSSGTTNIVGETYINPNNNNWSYNSFGQTSGLKFGWNYTGGAGRSGYLCNGQGGVGGHEFWAVNSSSNTPFAAVLYSGGLAISGNNGILFSNNIAIGGSGSMNVLQGATPGTQNIGMGNSALASNNGGNNNVALGWSSLATNSNGNNNTGVGYQAGQYNISGSQNTAIGQNAGAASGSGASTNSTAIGYNAQYTASNQIVLGTSSEKTVIPGDVSLNQRLFVGGDVSLNGNLYTNALTSSSQYYTNIVPNSTSVPNSTPATWGTNQFLWTASGSSYFTANPTVSYPSWAFNPTVLTAANTSSYLWKWITTTGQYNTYNTSAGSNTGAYVGSTSTSVSVNGAAASGINGEWLQLQSSSVSPNSTQFQLSSYNLSLSDAGIYTCRFPYKWYIVGSNDGSTWYALQFVTMSTANSSVSTSLTSYTNITTSGFSLSSTSVTSANSISYTVTNYTNTVNGTAVNVTPYKYFRLIATAVVGNNSGNDNGLLAIGQWTPTFASGYGYGVGIGTTTPACTLDVSGSARVSGGLTVSSGTTSLQATTIAGLATFSGDVSLNQRLFVGGNVGIGTTNPTNFLQIMGSSFTTASMNPDGGSSNNLNLVSTKTGSSPYSMALGVDYATGAGYINAAGNGSVQPVCINTRGGNVGIGTTTPGFPLHVYGGVNSSGNTGGIGYINHSGYNPNMSSWGANVSGQFENSIVVKPYVIFVSDRRIKTNIVDIDDISALDTLRLIQPKKYNYVDLIHRGPDPVWGFIAQQIREVLPYATNIVTDYIPNIYGLGTVSKDGFTVTLTTKSTTDISMNDTSATFIRFYGANDKQIDTEIDQIIDNETFTVKTPFSSDDLPNQQIFVYGKQVNDFHQLNKDAIYTIAVAALQEVDRDLQSTIATVQQQQSTITALESQVQQLQSQLNAVLARLSASGIA